MNTHEIIWFIWRRVQHRDFDKCGEGDLYNLVTYKYITLGPKDLENMSKLISYPMYPVFRNIMQNNISHNGVISKYV